MAADQLGIEDCEVVTKEKEVVVSPESVRAEFDLESARFIRFKQENERLIEVGLDV